MNNMYVFYNKKNLNILTIAKPTDTIFDIDEFINTRIQHDASYAGLGLNEIGCIIEDSTEYDRLINTDLNTNITKSEFGK